MTFDTRFNPGDEVYTLDGNLRATKFKVESVSLISSAKRTKEYYYDKSMDSHEGRLCFRSMDDLLAHVRGGGA